MKVLITGGAGFIGSNYIRHAFREHPDWEIWNLDKLTYAGNLDNLRQVERHPKYHFVRGDIADRSAVDQVMANGIEAIINFAAESHVDRSIASSDDFLLTGVIGVQRLLDAARQYRVRTFYQISTDEVYGDLPSSQFAKETDRLHPSSPYAAAKAAGDLLTLAYARTHRVPAVLSRCTNNYGPYQHVEKLLPLFVTNLLEGRPAPLYGDGMQIRDWLHVGDHCRAIDLVFFHGQIGEIYNVGANHVPEWTNRRVADLILRVLKQPETMIQRVADRPGHDRRYAVDTNKIERLGWKPSIALEDGLRQTIEWYVDHADWWRPVKQAWKKPIA